MKKLTVFFLITLIALLLTSGSLWAAMSSGDGYQIWADVISVGGIEQATSSGGFYLDDTLGEPVTGRSSTTDATMHAGFQEMVRGDILTLSVSPSSIILGGLSTSLTQSQNHTLTLNCSSASGVDVSFTGGTLARAGSGTVSAIGATSTTSQIGTSQFGFRVSGGASASVQSPYNGSQYAFHSNDNIISAPAAMTGAETFTVTYIANIAGTEPAGSYSTAITYSALASF